MSAVTLVLLGTTCMATANVLYRKPVQLLGVRQSLLIRSLLMATLALLIASLLASFPDDVPQKMLWGAVGLCSVATFGLIAFATAMRYSPASVVVPLANTAPVFTFMTAILVLGESAGRNTWAGFGLLVLGLGLLAFSELRTQRGAALLGIGFAVLAAMLWGVTFALFKPFIEVFGSTWFTGIQETAALAVVLLIFFFRTPQQQDRPGPVNKRVYVELIAVAILTTIGVLALNNALGRASAVVISVASAATPLLGVLIGVVYQKEQLSLSRLLGAVLFGACIALVSASA